MRILVIEDELKMAAFIKRGLKEQGYTVTVAANASDGLYQAEVSVFDLIILDRMLPERDGLTLCRELRDNGTRTPVLMLTARDAVDDRVAGLDAGADDYLTKPFAFVELLARVRALLRRGPASGATILAVDDLALDSASRQVTRGGHPLQLTKTEYALLEYLMRHAGQVVTRTMLAEHVWGLDFDTNSNVITVYINYLRKKLADGGGARLIHAVRGVGYVLRGENDAS